MKKATEKKMHITFSQEMVINLAVDRPKCWSNDDPNKSYIIAEAGGPQMANDGRMWFIGSFVAHLYHRGNFRFDAKFENIGGKQYVSVDHKKIK